MAYSKNRYTLRNLKIRYLTIEWAQILQDIFYSRGPPYMCNKYELKSEESSSGGSLVSLFFNSMHRNNMGVHNNRILQRSVICVILAVRRNSVVSFTSHSKSRVL